MTKTLARINAEIKAQEFVSTKMGMDLIDFTQREQIAYIKAEDARVITQEEMDILN